MLVSAAIANPTHRFIILATALVVVVACDLMERESREHPRLHRFDGMATVTSFDATTIGSTIHAVVVGKPDSGDRQEIFYVRSDDGGASWQRPVRMDRDATAPPLAGHGNEVQLAVYHQNLVAVWQQRGELPGVGPMTVRYSLDGGRNWQHGRNPTARDDLSGSQSFMDLATDASGQFHLVWLDDREELGNAQGLRYARSSDGGRTWQRDTTLDSTACTCCWNRIGALDDGRVVVLYRDDDPHDMRLSRSENSGMSWQSMAAVGDFGWKFSGCPHCGGSLTASASTDQPILHSIVWTGKTDVAGLYYLRSDDLGRSWSSPYPIGTPTTRQADIAAADEHLAAVFAERSAQGQSISLIRSEDGGMTWSAPAILTHVNTLTVQPRILSAEQGFLAMWTERDENGRDVVATTLLH